MSKDSTEIEVKPLWPTVQVMLARSAAKTSKWAAENVGRSLPARINPATQECWVVCDRDYSLKIVKKDLWFFANAIDTLSERINVENDSKAHAKDSAEGAP